MLALGCRNAKRAQNKVDVFPSSNPGTVQRAPNVSTGDGGSKWPQCLSGITMLIVPPRKRQLRAFFG
jgi:hypothetical protein